jgi:hypothetical protein
VVHPPMLTPSDGVAGAVVICYYRGTIAAGARAPVRPLVRRRVRYRFRPRRLRFPSHTHTIKSVRGGSHPSSRRRVFTCPR